MTLARWTHEHFDTLSWHDNAVHALRVVEGEYGAGLLIVDIDYILEWRPDESGGFSFLVAPPTRTFHSVSDLKVRLDYATPTAALTPFTIDRIDRRIEKRQHYDAVLWTLPVNWPDGEIAFEATGFVQELRAAPIVSRTMWLPRPAADSGA